MDTAADTQQTDRYELAVNAALAACDGDARATILALLIDVERLELEIDQLTSVISRGYVRGIVSGRKGEMQGWRVADEAKKSGGHDHAGLIQTVEEGGVGQLL